MNETKAAAQEFRDALFALAFFESDEAVFGLDRKGKIATCSRGAWDLLGREPGELEGTAFEALLPEKLRAQALELLGSLDEKGSVRNLDWSFVLKDGGETRARASVLRNGPALIVWLQRPGPNAGEWKLEDPALRDLLSRLQQIGAVGQLAAALAHQIRTPLHVIQSTVEFVQDELPGASPHQESLRVVNRNVDRIAALVDALRGFVRHRRHAMTPGDLNKVVEQACLFIEMLCKKRGIKLKSSLGAIPPVKLDAEYLLGALYNLMANAVEAMPDGGVLSVVTSVGGGDVTLLIQDTGKGMPQAVLDQIGRPFFTTKATGTGLGVMVAKEILEQHRARMRVESKHEVGTRIHISFPAA